MTSSPSSTGPPLGGRLGALAVVHPFPSLLNAAVVFVLAVVAAGDAPVAARLAVAMLALQFSIGAVNDAMDVDLDRRTKPWKPIPAGLVGRRTALVVGVLCGGAALALAALGGGVILLLAATMLGAGLAYDLGLKRGPWSWLPYAIALPLLPLYAWWGASSQLPPRAELIVPLAALAGPALQLANGLVDLERDRAGGVTGLAARLGRRRSAALGVVLTLVIHVVVWAALLTRPTLPVGLALAAGASVLAAGGLAFSAAGEEALRERGWKAQATSLGLLAIAWLVSTSGSPS